MEVTIMRQENELFEVTIKLRIYAATQGAAISEVEARLQPMPRTEDPRALHVLETSAKRDTAKR
jgi:hypothetical protein